VKTRREMLQRKREMEATPQFQAYQRALVERQRKAEQLDRDKARAIARIGKVNIRLDETEENELTT